MIVKRTRTQHPHPHQALVKLRIRRAHLLISEGDSTVEGKAEGWDARHIAHQPKVRLTYRELNPRACCRPAGSDRGSPCSTSASQAPTASRWCRQQNASPLKPVSIAPLLDLSIGRRLIAGKSWDDRKAYRPMLRRRIASVIRPPVQRVTIEEQQHPLHSSILVRLRGGIPAPTTTCIKDRLDTANQEFPAR